MTNMKPVVMYDGEVQSDEEIALIAGQCYMAKLGLYVTVSILRVDGERTSNPLTGRNVFRVHVIPGEHVIEIHTALGNSLIEGTAKNEYSLTVEAGRAYQINYEVLKDADDRDYIHYTFDNVGTVADYWNYFKANPDVVDGSPVPNVQK